MYTYMHRYLYAYINTKIRIIFFLDINECGLSIECSSNINTNFYPFGNDAEEDILSFLSDDGSRAILLSTGFVFYGTTYTTVFVSCKLSNFHKDHL